MADRQSPSFGFSSPVKEGLIYVSMSPIQFKGDPGTEHKDSYADTERYDRPDDEESRASALFDHFNINCLEGRRGSGIILRL
jgi:hypothetical protein